MQYLFLKLLPKNLFSRCMGFLADAQVPRPLLRSVINAYASHYRIDLDEMKTPWERIRCFNDFFTRELKGGLRPIDPQPDSLTSPVDGALAEFGEIENRLLVQAKVIYYSLADLVGEEESKTYEGGWFLTLYLSPADYHRIHTPFAGEVRRCSYFSGNLWPVNQLGVSQIGGLFAINERLYTPLETDLGTLGLVKVGATVVGKIKTTYNNLESNQGADSQMDLPVSPSRAYAKGEELGRFQLGSTVILLLPPGVFEPFELVQGMKLNMGQKLGSLQKVGAES